MNKPFIYLLHFFFYCDSNTKENTYLYGLAFPFPFSLSPHTDKTLHWSLLPMDNFPEVIEVRGQCSPTSLEIILESLESNCTLHDIINKLNIELSRSELSSKIERSIRSVVIFKERPIRRPPYLLLSEHESSSGTSRSNGHTSLSPKPMICNTLYNVDASLLPCLRYREFMNHLYPHASYRDMSRLGHFEAHSYLSHDETFSDNFTRNIRREECTNSNGEPYTRTFLDITLPCEYFHGQYGIHIQVSNTHNIFLDTLQVVTCANSDYLLTIPLQEDISTVHIHIYDLNATTDGTNLVANDSGTLMSHVHFDIQCVHRQLKISSINIEGKYSSHLRHSIFNASAPLWIRDEESIALQYKNLLMPPSTSTEGLFLSNGEENHTIFLHWLQNLFQRQHFHRIVLIDPYINTLALGKFLCCITQVHAMYEIYTSSQNKKLTDLQSITPVNMHLYTLPPKNLHDRILMLYGEEHTSPLIYTLSNSLDNFATKHGAIILPVTGSMALQLQSHYQQLFQKCRENHTLIEQFASSAPKLSDTNTEMSSTSPKITTRILSLLPHLRCEMDSSLKTLDNAKHFSSRYHPYDMNASSTLHSALKSLCRDNPTRAIKLLEITTRRHITFPVPAPISPSKEYHYYFASLILVYLAAELELCTTPKKLSELSESDYIYPFLHSDIAFIHALALTKLLDIDNTTRDSFPLEILSDICKYLTFREALYTYIYFIRALQICDCQNNIISNPSHPITVLAIQSFVEYLSNNRTNYEHEFLLSPNGTNQLYTLLFPLYSRNIESICCIISELIQSDLLDNDIAYKLYSRLFKEAYSSCICTSSDSACTSSIREDRDVIIAKYIQNLGGIYIEQFKVLLTELEENLSFQLGNAFLKRQNRHLWNQIVEGLYNIQMLYEVI